MEKLRLLEVKKSKSKMNNTEWNDIHFVLKKMSEEKIEIDGWYLTEIPYERTYLFYNYKDGKSFDFEIDLDGALKPHYYMIVQGSTVTKHPTITIREAIEKYEL